jgi:hypothetical protein
MASPLVRPRLLMPRSSYQSASHGRRIAIFRQPHRLMITRHDAARVLRPLDPCARRFGCDVKDTLNLDSAQTHEIRLLRRVIGQQALSSFFFEWPVYTAFGHMAKGYCLIAAPRMLVGSSIQRRQLASRPAI